MKVHIKYLSGDIETLTFQSEKVTLDMVKVMVNPMKNHKVILFKDDIDEKETKIDDGDILNVFYNKEEFTFEEVESYERKLENIIPFYEDFKAEIIKNKALIAGGSVLSVFGNYPIKDLDIYIHYSKAFEFIKFLLLKGIIYGGFNSAPAYDESFFRKNHIVGRFNMHVRSRSRRYTTGIDIMIIPDHIPLENIVTNFDLTFCQVWWNGIHMYSDDIDDVRNKSGSLNKGYIRSFLNINNFIINRIKKYKERGFKISIDMSEFSKDQLTITKSEKSISECAEEWGVSKLCYYILEKVISWRNCLLFFDIYPQEMKIEKVREKLGEQLFESVVRLYYYNVCSVIDFGREYTKRYESLFNEILLKERDDDADNVILDMYIEELNRKLSQIETDTQLIRRIVMPDNIDNINVNGDVVINGNLFIHGNLVIGVPPENNVNQDN